MLPLYPVTMAKFQLPVAHIRLRMGNITKLQLLLPHAAALPDNEACLHAANVPYEYGLAPIIAAGVAEPQARCNCCMPHVAEWLCSRCCCYGGEPTQDMADAGAVIDECMWAPSFPGEPAASSCRWLQQLSASNSKKLYHLESIAASLICFISMSLVSPDSSQTRLGR